MGEFDYLPLHEATRRLVDAFQEFAHTVAEVARETFTRIIPCLLDQIDGRAITAAKHATPKELHYILHGRKARTRKKYINRVLRRVGKQSKEAGQ